MKTQLIKIIVFVVVLLGIAGAITGMAIKIRNQTVLIEQTQQTVSAYAAEADSLQNQCKVFKLDLATMLNLNDSIMIKMYEQAKSLKIKDKQIESLQYRLDHTEKTTEIIIRDTIFVNPTFKLDTLITDAWSSTQLSMYYPGNITITSKFNNEQYVIVHWKKVPIKARKCKIAEWFTKKRKEIIVDVISENPYVNVKKQRFVEIID